MEWKQISEIPGYEEYTNYILNIQGELLNTKTGNMRKWSSVNCGYMCAYLKQAPAKSKKILQHRAICCLFLPNPMNLPAVDHINRKPHDNRISNLRWVTALENQHNQGIRITNTTGEPNILKTVKDGKPVWRIEMRFMGKDLNKYVKRDTDEIPQEVKNKRNAMQLEIQTELENERNNLILQHL